MILFLTRQGLRVRLENGRVALYENMSLLAEVPREQIRQVIAFGNIHFTTPFLSWALSRKIPVFFLTQTGRLKGHLAAPNWSTPALRKNLYLLSLKPDLRVAFSRRFVRGKIQNSRAFLEMVQRRGKERFSEETDRMTQLIKQLKSARNLEEIRAIEAQAAKIYYSAFPKVFPQWPFRGRFKHPPQDEMNSLLSLGYTLLYTTVTAYLWVYDLDPSIGIYHQPRSGFYSLAADVMEMFRAPVVDLVVYRAVRKGWIQRGDFDLDHRSGYFLVPEKLRLFLTLYRRRLEEHGMKWNRKITAMVRDLAKAIRVLKPEFEEVRWR